MKKPTAITADFRNDPEALRKILKHCRESKPVVRPAAFVRAAAIKEIETIKSKP